MLITCTKRLRKQDFPCPPASMGRHPDKTLVARILEIPLVGRRAANCLLMPLKMDLETDFKLHMLIPLSHSNVGSSKLTKISGELSIKNYI